MRKIYLIKGNRFATLPLLLAIVAILCGELLTVYSSVSNSTYAVEPLRIIMACAEAGVGTMAAALFIGLYFRGTWAMHLLDALRFISVVLVCVCLYLILSERATLMGYVWFSDLESGNANSVLALNYGVASAALYAVAVILATVSGAFELVSAKKVTPTAEQINAEIERLRGELEELGGGQDKTN